MPSVTILAHVYVSLERKQPAESLKIGGVCLVVMLIYFVALACGMVAVPVLHQVHQGATRRWLAAFCLHADFLVVVRAVSESVSEYRLQPSPAVRVRPCFDARA